MSKFTIANLEMACWIARLGSFTAAADRLNTTQPAISARVRDLEEDLKLKLFERHPRGVELTIEGREFLQNVEPLLRQLEELSFTTSQLSAGGVIRLGTSSICLELIADLVDFSHEAFPNVSYEIETDRAANLLNALEARKLDVAIVSGPVDPYRFSSLSLGLDEMLWVISAQRLKECGDCEVAELFSRMPIWCVSHDSFYWATAAQSLSSHSVRLSRVNELSNTLAAARIISHGGGIGLLSRTAVSVEMENGTLVQVPGLAPCSELEFRIVCRKDAEDSKLISSIMKAAAARTCFEIPQVEKPRRAAVR